MSKIAVVYKSKYGSTEKYAKWIAEELKGDLYNYSKVNVNVLDNYDVIIFGGGIYAGGIAGISFITKNFAKIKDKKLVVFSCGLSNPEDKASVENLQLTINKTFNTEMKDKIKFFYFRGGIDYKHMSFAHKLMMKMFNKILSKKDPKSIGQGEKDILDAYGKTIDYTNKVAIKPLVEFINQ